MLPAWLTTIRGKVPLGASVVLGALPILAIVGIWFFLTWGEPEERIVAVTILPSPGEVFSAHSLSLLFKERDITHHILVSLRRVVLGYLLAIAVVLPLGVGMGAFGSIRAMFTPTTTASGYIPIATLVPLTMSWFGTGEKQKVVFLGLAFGVYLLPMVISAIARVPEVYLRTAYTLGAGRMGAVFRVLIPVALPDLWQSMRLAFGIGWTYLVLTEVVVLVDGLGYLIAISQRRGPREHIYLVIIVITLIAWVADILWTRVGKWLFPYQEVHA